MSAFKDMFAEVRRPFRRTLALAILCGAGVAASAVALLGVSGWFLGGAAGGRRCGRGGSLRLQLSAAGRGHPRPGDRPHRPLRYFERYHSHAAALRTLGQLRPRLFGRLVAADPQAVLALSRGEASARLVEDAGCARGRGGGRRGAGHGASPAAVCAGRAQCLARLGRHVDLCERTGDGGHHGLASCRAPQPRRT